MSKTAKRTLTLLKKTKGLHSNLAYYENAASFGDALELFFQNLNRDLKRLMKKHNSATSKCKTLKKKPIKKKSK
jgi:retron-type reverse transcriptase